MIPISILQRRNLIMNNSISTSILRSNQSFANYYIFKIYVDILRSDYVDENSKKMMDLTIPVKSNIRAYQIFIPSFDESTLVMKFMIVIDNHNIFTDEQQISLMYNASSCNPIISSTFICMCMNIFNPLSRKYSAAHTVSDVTIQQCGILV